jgi:2-polyprenyl-3-methyl-5-hydroxy-6-metoxy-1,4-benzoquinol methylase
LQDDTEYPAQQDPYMHDYDGALTEQIIAGRTADVHGAFFLPYLRAGMDVLDCGCGPGSITVGLAEAVTPGSVTGIDLEESQLARACETASGLGLTNVTFETADVHNLPFEDGRFDAVFSHAMLEHLPDPVPVLAEMRRVLKPGGLAAIRCIDLGGTIIAPDDGRLAAGHELWRKYRQHCGGDAFMGRRLRALLREAGFARTVGTTSSETWATPERAQSMSSVMTDEFTGPKIAQAAIQMGWADQAELEGIARALDDWGAHPDAFMAIVWAEAVGWKEQTC